MTNLSWQWLSLIFLLLLVVMLVCGLAVNSLYKGIASQSLIYQGEQLARDGDIGAALEKYEDAHALNTGLELSTYFEKAAQSLVNQGEQLARDGDVEAAILKFSDAQELGPSIEISAGSWNTLCWYGSLWERAAEVTDACEKAVVLAQEGVGRDGE